MEQFQTPKWQPGWEARGERRATSAPGSVESTVDRNTVIIERGEYENGVPYVVYENTDGERWRIDGRCSCCGCCEVGVPDPDLVWTGVPVGEPGACFHRKWGEPGAADVPTRPELREVCAPCTLTGEYLAGGGE
jgi:hypothetical protein